MIELEFLIERCWENAQEYERTGGYNNNPEYEEQLANFISNEEKEMNQFYAELEDSLHNPNQFEEYKASIQNQNMQNQNNFNHQQSFN